MEKKILELQNVTKKFSQGTQEIFALKNANLQLKKGEITALIGPSGSGKTTLLQIAGLLDRASSGKIFINEIEISNENSSTDDNLRTKLRRQNIGFIYQFHHLLPEFSVLENVALPLLISGVAKNEALKKAHEILAQVDLLDRLHQMPSQLSGGQQQRTAIARAIASNPSLILADEPTGNLDSVNAQKIFDLLRNLTKEFGVACLLVTHNVELAKKLDRVVRIVDGVIA